MQTRSNDWRSIVATKNFWLEVKATINGVAYTSVAGDGNSGLTAPVIDRAMFTNDLSVGNCIAASCTLSVMANSANIPKSAAVQIEARVCRENPSDPSTPILRSEYRPFGTFYVSKRTENKEKGLVTLQCYDAMLKANQLYITNPSADPTERQGWTNGKAMSTCVTEIATRLGISLDSRTTIRTGEAYKLQYPAHYVTYSNVNPTTQQETEETKLTGNYTMADVLSLIAGVHGGNWVITPENKLRLIPLIRPPSGSSSSDDGSTASEAVQMTVGVPIVIGKIDTGKQLTITRVSVSRDKEEVYQTGNSNGIDLKVSGSPYETVLLHTTARDYLYSTFCSSNALTYNPYTIEKACMDPCAELGDRIVVKEGNTNRVLSVICAQKLTLGNEFRVNLSAPAKVEEENEYPFQTQTQKLQGQIKKLQATSESFIEQTNNRIALEVVRREAADNTLSGRIQVNADNISLKVSKANLVSDLNSELTITNNAINVTTGHFIVNGNADPSTVNFKLDSNGNIWANNAHLTSVTASGSFTTNRTSGGVTYSTISDAGEIQLKKNGSTAAEMSIWSSAYPLGSHSNAIDAFTIHVHDIPFVIGTEPTADETDYGWYYRFVVNDPSKRLGINEWVYAEDLFVHGPIRFNNSNGPEIQSGTGNTFLVGTDTNQCGLAVWGTKNRVVLTDNYGAVGMNAMESAAAVFSDMGSGILDENGTGYVFIAPDFAETIDLSHRYQVFLTQTSEGGISWTEKKHDHFIVHGEPGTTFDWIIYAKQRDYTNHRMESFELQENDPNMEAGVFPQVSDDTIEESAEMYLRRYEEEIYGKRS